MRKRLSRGSKARIINSHSRRVGRRNHAEVRLKERFGLEYTKLKNVIDNGGAKLLLECRGGDRLFVVYHMGQEVYYKEYAGDIKTFLTKEMVEKSYPEVFEPPKPKPKKKKPKKKKRRIEFIPASELFGDK